MNTCGFGGEVRISRLFQESDGAFVTGEDYLSSEFRMQGGFFRGFSLAGHLMGEVAPVWVVVR